MGRFLKVEEFVVFDHLEGVAVAVGKVGSQLGEDIVSWVEERKKDGTLESLMEDAGIESELEAEVEAELERADAGGSGSGSLQWKARHNKEEYIGIIGEIKKLLSRGET